MEEAAPLTAADLAGRAGVAEAEIGRLVDLGILVPRDGPAPFLTIDLRKVRLAAACERAGLPMDAIAAAIRTGRLSFAFLEAAPYHRWAAPSSLTYRQVSEETASPWTCSGRRWRRWGSPGRRRTSRCARTVSRWSRSWPSGSPPGSSTRRG